MSKRLRLMSTCRKLAVVSLILCCWSQALYAATITASPGGSVPGTQTLTDAAAAIAPGDTLALHPGTYVSTTQTSVFGIPSEVVLSLDVSDIVVRPIDGAVGTVVLAPLPSERRTLGVLVGASAQDVTIQRIEVEGADEGLCATGSGRLEDVEIRGGIIGVFLSGASSIQMRACAVSGASESGVWALGNQATLEVESGSFDDTVWYGILVTQGASANVEGTTITNTETGISMQTTASGRVTRCVVRDTDFGVESTSGAHVELTHSTVSGRNQTLAIGEASHMTVDSTEIVGAGGNNVLIAGNQPTATIRHSTFGGTRELDVWVLAATAPPLRELDFTWNSWGTNDLEEIRARILDAVADPSLFLRVNIEPIREDPVSEATRTFGSMKKRFREPRE